MVKIEPDKENGLEKTSAIDAFQVRSVAQERFVKRIGEVSDDILDKITRALAIVLSIPFDS
jgi:mRNA interferase MazF